MDYLSNLISQDGQHRLYGYSDSKYAKTNSIPVVAFVNMDQKEQVKLFMEINENQKAVPKNLRNTLNADLLWTSDDPSERREALRSRIAQDLGDSMKSPLNGRVIIGEEQADDYRCITLEMICLAIDASGLLSKYAKDKTLQAAGTLDLEDSDKTLVLVEKFIFGCLNYLRTILPEEWNKNPKKDGMLLFNNAIGGLIRLFGDIATELINKGFDPKKTDEFLEESQYYLDPIEGYVNNLSEEDKNELRTNYGGNGPRHFWRKLQKAVHEAHEEFLPEGYVKYWEDHGKSYNADSVRIMTETEKEVRKYVKKVLESNFPQGKWIQQIPKKVYTEASSEASKHQYETGEATDVWDYFTMLSLREIITYGANWSSFFEKVFPISTDEKGNKKDKTEWMATIDKLQKNAGRANFSVAKSQYETLQKVETQVLPRFI